MQNHPDHRYLTAQRQALCQNASLAASPPQEFSLDEKNADFLDSCVRAASLAVDEARAALTAALAGQDDGLADHAARAYKLAAGLHLQAQQERYSQRVSTVGTPEWAADQRGQQEVRQDLIDALSEAERRGQLEGSAADVLAELDAWLDFQDDDDFLPPPPPAHSQGSTEMRGDLR